MANKITPEMRERIDYLRGVRGKSPREIGLKLGLTADHVAWHCLANGIDSPKLKEPPKLYTRQRLILRKGKVVRAFTPEEDQQMIALRLQQKSLRAIGKALGREHSSIKMRLATLARYDERREAEL